MRVTHASTHTRESLMMLKIRKNLRSILPRARRNDGALTMLQIAGLIIGPLVMAMIGFALVSTFRLGGDLTTVFTRDTVMTQMVERMQLHLTNTTEVEVRDDHAFTSRDQPSRRSAYYVPSGDLPDYCVTNTWELTPDTGDTLTLRNVEERHEADSCDSPVTGTSERTLTGLTADTVFAFDNAYGRDLTFVEGDEAGPQHSANARPDGLFTNEWEYPYPGFVTISGTLNQPFGTTPVHVTAKTSMKQLRPGVVSSDLGELGPPIIQRIDRGGDTFRAQFSAVTSLRDPRVKLEWSWREAYNQGADATDLPSTGWSGWTDWTTQDYFDTTVNQGTKWQVQAKYRLVLDAEVAESETVTMTWVRPIDAIAAPTVTIAAASGGNAALTVTAADCWPGTTPGTRSRSLINAEAWSEWAENPGSPFTRSVAVGQGQQLTGQGGNRCTTPFAQGPWTDSVAPYATYVRPITAAPTIRELNATVTAPEDRGIIGAVLEGCPAGTTYQARYRYATNAAAWADGPTGFAPVNTTPTYNAAAVREGDRFRGGLYARCVSPYFAESPAAQADSGYTVNPIRTRPTVTSPTSVIRAADDAANASATIGGCPTHLTYEARLIAMGNAATAWSRTTFADATAGRVSYDSPTAYYEGYRFRGGIEARCASPYATGPGTDGASTGYVIRPVTSPAAPTVEVSNLYPADGAAIYTITRPGCATGTTRALESRSRYNLASAGTWETWLSHDPDWKRQVNGVPEGARIDAQARVMCDGLYADSPWVTSDAATRPFPITSAPTVVSVTINVPVPEDRGIVSGRLSGCPAGTTYEARYRYALNEASWATATGFLAASTTFEYDTVRVREGERAAGGVTARCVTAYAEGPTAERDSGYRINPVRTTPTIRNVNAIIIPADDRGRAAADLSGCPAHLSYQARLIAQRNAGEPSYGSFEAVTAGRVGFNSSAAYYEGYRFRGGVSARCLSDYSTGAAEELTQTAWEIRPVTAPAAPVVDITNATPSTEQMIYTIIQPSCATGTSRVLQNHYQLNGGSWTAWVESSPEWKRSVEGVREGARLVAEARAKCVGEYAESDWRTGSSTGRSQVISSTPTVSGVTSYIAAGSRGQVDANLAGCPAGTRYEMRAVGLLNSADGGTWGDYSAASAGKNTRITDVTVEEGYRFRGGVRARCVTDYVEGDYVQLSDSSWNIRAVTRPTLGTVTSTLSGASLRIESRITDCAASTTYQAMTISIMDAGAWTRSDLWRNVTAGTIAHYATQDVSQGQRARGGYDVRCSGLYADSPVVTGTDDGWKTRGISLAPTMRDVNAYVESGDGRIQGYYAGGCQPHMKVQPSFYGRHDYQARWVSETGYGTHRAVTDGTRIAWAGYGINQGAYFEAAMRVRCVTDYAEGSASNVYVAETIRPITTTPTASPFATLSGASVGIGVSSFSACPAGTTPMWQQRSRVNGGSLNAYSGWLAASAGTQWVRTIDPGDSAQGYVNAVCRSDFTNGPAWGDWTNTVYRAIPAPGVPDGTNIHTLALPTGRLGVSTVAWSANAPSYATQYQGYVVVTFNGNRVVTSSTQTSSSPNFTFSCIDGAGQGFLQITAYTRAGNSSGWSGWTSATRSAATSVGGTGCN